VYAELSAIGRTVWSAVSSLRSDDYFIGLEPVQTIDKPGFDHCRSGRNRHGRG
jgi:hypothetical protein